MSRSDNTEWHREIPPYWTWWQFTRGQGRDLRRAGGRRGQRQREDPDNRAAKNRGERCFYYGCQVPQPRFGVLWKCPAGHREEILYCPEHGPEMMARSLKDAGNVGPICVQCSETVLMLPVAEGGPVTEPLREVLEVYAKRGQRGQDG